MRHGLTLGGLALAALSLATAAAGQDLESRLAAADPAAGEAQFRQCKTCHTPEKGGANRVGPNLYGVLGRDIGSVEGFRYSSVMADAEGDWTPAALDAFLEDPRAYLRGTRMSFRGLSDAQDRADMIAYLNTLSDAPQALGAAETESTEDTGAEPSEEPEFGQLVMAPGVEETYYACTACHSEMIVAQQGKTRDGWDKLLVWMVDEQGMPEIPVDERDVILDYLAEHYNTDRPNFPRN